MQCGCPQCGILMSLENRGIESQCRCPNCLYTCSACLGTKCVLSVEQIKDMEYFFDRDEQKDDH